MRSLSILTALVITIDAQSLVNQPLLLILVFVTLPAQTGGLRGQVKNDSGAVVASAKVDLTSAGGEKTAAISDAGGNYLFANLIPGNYTLAASASSLSQPEAVAVKIRLECSGGGLPPKSSIREIRINQNPFSPEYDNKLGYRRIEILTKPGGDRYRSTGNYNLGTRWWNTRNPYSSQKAPFRLNEFEGNVGGPLGKRASF